MKIKTRFLILFFIVSLMLTSCIPKPEYLDYDYSSNITIPETDKKFYVEFSPFYIKNFLKGSKLYDSICKYFKDKKSDTKENAYIFKLNVEEIAFYSNLTQDDKRKWIFVIENSIMIYSQEKKLLLNLFLSNRNEEITDSTNDTIPNDIKERLLTKTYSGILEQLNSNQNYLNFISENLQVKKVIDETTNYKNRTGLWEDLLKTNKKNYRLFFSFNYGYDMGGMFNLTNYHSDFLYRLFLGFEFYPSDIFSMEYRLECFQPIFGLCYNYFRYRQIIFQFYNEVSFKFKILEQSHNIPFIYFNIGYQLDYMRLSSFTNEYMQYTASYTVFPNPTESNELKLDQGESMTINIYSMKFALGYILSLTNPYVSMSNVQYGVEFFYMASYLDLINNWFHTIGFAFSFSFHNNTYVYRNKPYKLVTSKRFQKR